MEQHSRYPFSYRTQSLRTGLNSQSYEDCWSKYLGCVVSYGAP